jgi:plasmid stability protein
MAGLLIKDLPDRLHRTLKARAAATRRSLSAEAITILESALDDRSGPPTLDEIDRMRVRGARPLTQALLDRAKRDRDRR